jgi:hypothetical protein
VPVSRIQLYAECILAVVVISKSKQLASCICLENRNFHPVADGERPLPTAAAPRQHDHSARKATNDSLFKKIFFGNCKKKRKTQIFFGLANLYLPYLTHTNQSFGIVSKTKLKAKISNKTN